MYHCDGCGVLRDEDFDVPEEINGKLICGHCLDSGDYADEDNGEERKPENDNE